MLVWSQGSVFHIAASVRTLAVPRERFSLVENTRSKGWPRTCWRNRWHFTTECCGAWWALILKTVYVTKWFVQVQIEKLFQCWQKPYQKFIMIQKRYSFTYTYEVPLLIVICKKKSRGQTSLQVKRYSYFVENWGNSNQEYTLLYRICPLWTWAYSHVRVGWARVPLSSFFLKFPSFFLIFRKLSSFLPSGWPLVYPDMPLGLLPM